MRKNDLDHLSIDVERIAIALDLDVTLVGKELVGLCPFHQERTNPNLELNSDSGLWHCWVCGHKGNLPQLIMELRTVSYREAVRFLEDHSDIPSVSEIRERNIQEFEAIRRPIERIKWPSVSIDQYEHGRTWWHHVRSFDYDTIREFHLGYDSAHRRATIPIGF